MPENKINIKPELSASADKHGLSERLASDGSFKKPELLAPAGDLEKLKAAFLYGADAAYVAGERFGLRARAGNFNEAELREGVSLAREMNKRIYAAVNIFAHNADLSGFSEYVETLLETGVDAFIVSDAGLFQVIRKTAPGAEIHISTQANTSNYAAVNFWYEQGARRVVLSRELSLSEVAEIRRNIPSDMSIECFVHGAMCMSYSGRCYLSSHLSGRDANKGDCSQPCRWEYALVEKNRQGEYMPVSQDSRGSYILNSKDLRMIAHVPELMEAGVSSFKIEGRMKTAYYVASTVSAYRRAIDDYFESPEKYRENIPHYLAETEKTSHRRYCKGFYFGEKDDLQHCESSSYIRGYDYVGIVTGYEEASQTAFVSQRNKFSVGDTLEVLSCDGDNFSFTVTEMRNENDEVIDAAPHAEQLVKLRVPRKICGYNILRRAQR